VSNRIWISALAVAVLVTGYFLYRHLRPNAARLALLREWLNSPESHPEWAMQAGSRCGEAPFLFPTDGLVGFLWDDNMRLGHRHQGIDVFGGSEPGHTPVVAAYDGYLTRLPEWKSAVIVRVPSDPLKPGRQIWLYYTHMADQDGDSNISSEFPPGTTEKFVQTGTLLGRQGNYSGDPYNPVGVHLHFSIVLDDGQGGFRNELEIKNTLDPSPYLRLELNAGRSQGEVPVCGSQGGRDG
jgi:hypothetical protein